MHMAEEEVTTPEETAETAPEVGVEEQVEGGV